jgi:branched-chain amino acid transport system ATP-binding protein/branched-chain amino acid transport system permease protein
VGEGGERSEPGEEFFFVEAVDHHLDLALALSDRTVILERGSVTWTGASKLLRDDLDLRRQKLWM